MRPYSKVLLASASPRRRELLRLVFPQFEVLAADADETPTETEPCRMVEQLALRKARAVAKRPEAADSLVIGADTLVFAQGAVLGKPKDEQDALAMLRSLSGTTHQVITGVALTLHGAERVFSEVTEVEFAPMTEEEMQAYVASGDPMDKAGAYGIQGGASRFIRGIRGCYFNVVGLPVHRLYEEWKAWIEQE